MEKIIKLTEGQCNIVINIFSQIESDLITGERSLFHQTIPEIAEIREKFED